MESRRSSQWSFGRPFSRAVLIILLASVVGYAGGPWFVRSLGPGLSSFFSNFRSGVFHRTDSNLRQQNELLRGQLQVVTDRLQEAEARLATTEAVTKLEVFTRSKRITPLYAQVLAYSPDPGIQSITINRGQGEGIRVGLAAVSGEGFVIGLVRRVTSHTATILLITDPQARLVAKVKNASESRGLLQGEQGLSIHLGFIPKHESITPGQLIITSGADPLIPPDLPIGTVGSVRPQPGDLFQSVNVVTPVDIQNLIVVAIIPSSL